MENKSNRKEELRIYSELVKDILSEPPRSIFRIGNTIILIFTIILLLLSWLIKYPNIISAEAVITSHFPPQKEFSAINGKIDTIFVVNNQTVSKNLPLALIANNASYSDVILLKAILDSLSFNSPNFTYPIDKIPVLTLGEIQQAYFDFENNYIEYDILRNSQSFKLNNLTYYRSLSQLKSQLNILSNQKILFREELEIIRADYERSEQLYENNTFSKLEFEQKRLEKIQSERNYQGIEASISQIRETIARTENAKSQAVIDFETQKRNTQKAVIHAYRELNKAINDWELKYLFKSNIDGRVTFMKVWNKNQSIASGDFVFTIVPNQPSSLVAKVKAPIANSGKIKIGQDVIISLDGFPASEFGKIYGAVKQISLIPNNENHYLIDVPLPTDLTTSYNIKIDFNQEMSGIAEIITDESRLLERILFQFRELFMVR